jgi:hypothetical protein
MSLFSMCLQPLAVLRRFKALAQLSLAQALGRFKPEQCLFASCQLASCITGAAHCVWPLCLFGCCC